MNLEIPSKYKGVLNMATMAAKTIFRPVSRKYDLEEHAYPVELDLLAAGLNGLNEGSGNAIGGAATSKGDADNSTVKNGGNIANCINIQAMWQTVLIYKPCVMAMLVCYYLFPTKDWAMQQLAQ